MKGIKTIKTFLIKKYRKLRSFYYKKITKRFLFEVQLAHHCNLNCVSCSHFSPIADEIYLDAIKYEKDCEQLSKISKNLVYLIHLMGGEPLLHKDIVEIIEITRKYFKKSKIKVVTNGILLDRMEPEFWKACKDNRVIVSITYYPIKINIEKINELSSHYGVKIESFKRDRSAIFRKDVLDPAGLQNKKESFKICAPRCHHLFEGKLYLCRVAAYINYINKNFSKHFQVADADYIDIYQVKDTKTIINYLRNPILFCRYCNRNATSDIPWGLSKKEESEWF